MSMVVIVHFYVIFFLSRENKLCELNVVRQSFSIVDCDRTVK